MSLTAEKSFPLDFTRNAPLEYIFVKAGDKDSRVLDITPLKSGLFYEIPEGTKVVFAAKKPDGTEILNYAALNTSTGHIEVVLSEQTLACEGILICDIGLYNESGQFISSQHFYMKASPFALSDVRSSNEYNTLVVALLSVDAKIREVEKAIEGIHDAVKDITPSIGETGNWLIGGKDTGKTSRGEKGDIGPSGVYVGSGEMPEGYNVQVDPEGSEVENLVLSVNGVLPDENGDVPVPSGYTPIKGVDYYTDADKAEIVDLVLAALPTWSGGSY